MCNTCGCKSAESDSHQHCAGCNSHDLNAESIFCASCTKTMDAETYGSETMEKNAEYGTRNRYKLNGSYRYVARDSKGKFISNVDMGRSLAADKREPKPTRYAKAGKRGMGDANGHKHAETFEAMASLPPGRQDIEAVKAAIRSANPGVRFQGDPVYLTERSGSANKFHVFINTNMGGFNGYGRIGYSPQVYGPMSSSQYNKKMGQKMRKGYSKTKAAETFEAQKYGKRNRYKLNGNQRYVARNAKGEFISNVDVGRSLRQDRRSNAKSQKPVGFRGLGDAKVAHHAESLTNAIVQWEDDSGMSAASSPPNDIMWADQVELAKPVETGAKIGLGFMLLSAGSVIAASALGMLLGDN